MKVTIFFARLVGKLVSREVFHNRIKLAQMVKSTGNTLCSNLIPTSQCGERGFFGDFKFRLRWSAVSRVESLNFRTFRMF